MRRTARSMSTVSRLILFFVLALTVGACTNSNPSPPNPTAEPAPVVLTSTQDSVLIPAGTPEEVTTQLSAALFETSPAVVLVDDSVTSPPDLGLPVLAVSSDDATASPSGTASTGPTDPIADEVRRLEAGTVLALGPQAQARADQLDVTVVTDPQDLTLPPRPSPGHASLLVTADPQVSELDAVTVTAITATGTAGGATPLNTVTGDPRESATTVDATAAAEPGRVIGVGSGLGSLAMLTARVATAATGVQLPGGGQLHHPGRLYVALYGHPGAPVLGVLGEQDLSVSLQRAREHADQYTALTEDTVIPMFEIIATVATSAPGPDGSYSRSTDPETLRPWIEQALAEDVYVVLDLQPGRDDLLDQAKRYESLLAHPNVGLAIDPEWKLGPDQRPLQQIGQVSAPEVNRVSDWLANYTRTEHLPQKLLVLHQFQTRMLPDRADIVTDHDELQVLIHVDGQGSQGEKQGTWRTIITNPPPRVTWGWKNFYDEDSPMLTSEQTMAQVDPSPMMISYQ